MEKAIYSPAHKKIVLKLRRTRLALGLSQTVVAKELGRTQSYISKLEAGQRRIDLTQLKELARIYKRDIKHFL